MKIPLTDPVWTRLYGPYGVESVNEILQELQKEWDDEIAKDLFWERLHHQDTLYPVTYAAIPWLVDIAPKDSIKTYSFLSHVLAQSSRTEDVQGSKVLPRYQGLSLDPSDHGFSWLETFLTPEDMITLASLQQWFTENSAEIAERSVNLVGTAKLEEVGYLLAGPIYISGSRNAAEALCLWSTGEHPDYVTECSPPQSHNDVVVAEQFAKRFENECSEVATFLRDWKRNLQ